MSQCPCHPQRQHIIRSHGVPIPPQTQLTGAHDMAFEPTLLPIFPENYHPNQWEKKMVTHVDVPHPGNWSPLPRYPDDVEVAAAPEVHRRMPPPTVKKGTPWTEDEHRLFLLGLKIYRRGNWRSISRYCVISRTSTQVASHAQKYFIRQEIPKNERKRRSIHDITLEDESNQIQNWFPPLTLPDNHNWVPPLPNVAMQQARELQQTQQMLHPDPLQELQQPQDTSNSNPHLMELSRFLMKTCKN